MFDYPPQEPISQFARPYHEKLIAIADSLSPPVFAFGENAYQKLAVFESGHSNADALIMWHGGGWTNGYRQWMYFMAPALNAIGVTLICAGYRLAPQHYYPACFDDCAAAVAWVHNNAVDIGIARDRIFLSGHSAGGHLAALLGVRSDWQEQYGLPTGVVRGCLPISGTYLFGENSGLSMRPRFIGDTDDVAVSPIAQIKRTPPFLIAFGSEDFPHLITQSRDMAAALAQAGGNVECLELENCDHLGASLAAGEADGVWIKHAAKWMDLH